ncbi:hypothetical protein L3V82_05400 [Thiotrichales bacterium 19S3-7]|nr:hypothetical protein [Thiotrichales bacterium 19S3-7]MCF6801529.1 hypothetical protein [Thiotrichales bacterium 19S3-11]
MYEEDQAKLNSDRIRARYYSKIFSRSQFQEMTRSRGSDVKSPLFTGSEKIYLHMTDSENVKSILENGLIPGFKPGMGRANLFGKSDERDLMCPEGIYVVNPKQSILDCAEANFFIITLDTPCQDVNYRHDKKGNFPAGFFAIPPEDDAIKPLHQAKFDDKNKTYCFRLIKGDLDPQTKDALAKLGILDTRWITEKVKQSFPLQYNVSKIVTPPSSPTNHFYDQFEFDHSTGVDLSDISDDDLANSDDDGLIFKLDDPSF